MRGLTLDDYRDGVLHVTRSVWRRHILEPKTERSKAAVPVISLLAKMLDGHKKGLRPGPLFRGDLGRPLNLDNLARRVIIPVLKLSDIEWHGWHAFRRGLATNLHQLGVNDKTIQEILRHSSLATTQEIYIKTVSAESAAAMKKLEAALEQRIH